MKPTIYDEKEIRKYLLGDLHDTEQTRIEQRLVTDDEYFELLEVIEDELIDDYALEQLSEQEREQFEANFLTTLERRRKLKFAITLRSYTAKRAVAVEPQPSRGSALRGWLKRAFTPSRLKLATVLIIIVAVGLGIWRIFLYNSGARKEGDVEKGLAALRKAYGNGRPLEARISGFDYAPVAVTRGNEQDNIDYTARDCVERILLDAVDANPNPVAFHALGKLYLAERKFDKAIVQFEKALKGAPDNAQLHSDYGAALLETGKASRSSDESGKSLEQFARSFEHLNKALELDGSLLEALFNRALAHKEMMLPTLEEQDWRAYIEKDPDSNWANEARRNLKQLEEQKQNRLQSKEDVLDLFLSAYKNGDDERAWSVISKNKEAVSGKLIFEQLLNRYLDLSLKNASESDGGLQALSYAAKLETERAGDRYFSDPAHFYGLTSPAQRRALVEAQRLMSEGHKNYVQSRFKEAADSYSRARNFFRQAGDGPETSYAEYWMGFAIWNWRRRNRACACLSAWPSMAARARPQFVGQC